MRHRNPDRARIPALEPMYEAKMLAKIESFFSDNANPRGTVITSSDNHTKA
jgi:hypothetical protein